MSLTFNKKIRYPAGGAAVGLVAFLWHLGFLYGHGPSVGIYHVFLVGMPTFVVGLPWSLISLAVDDALLKATIISIGISVNGAAIGAAYASLADADS